MPLRLWLNDVPSGHYGNALPALADLNAVVQEVLSLPALPTFTIATCDAGYPASLEPGIADGLHAHFAKWGANARGRLGYLDPMRYRIRNPQAGETSSTDHLAWLRLLSNGFSRPAMSVHFTGHRNWVNLRPEVTRMHHDGVTAGFPHSLTGSHKHYHVVVNIRCSTDATALELAHRLQQAVDAAWTHWAAAVGTDTPNKLTLVVQ
jgi:hypothetical protein